MSLAQCLLGLTFALCNATVACAQSCNFAISTIDFGNIDITSGAAATATATYTATCSALVSATRMCPSIADGTGGSTAGSPRYLLNAADRLAFNLYADVSYTTVWGSYFSGYAYTPPAIDITTVVVGNGSISRTVYARIAAGQQTLPAGVYTSSFAGANTRVTFAAYALGLYPPDCASLSSPFDTAPFTVTANIVASCSVSATSLDFGAVGILSANTDSTNALNVTCTARTPYVIALNGGASGASDPAQRKMVKAGETVTYGLYRDAARALPWGSLTGTNTVAATGAGVMQVYTVYGRVPAQPTPSPGLYSDTIVVTITY